MNDQPARQNLYRKYRPRTFAELLGQDHVVRTLQAAVSTGRTAHAYMFSGPRGTGKTSAARLLAKILNCRQPLTMQSGMKDACGTCENCRRIEDMTFMDIVEIDAASNNGVDDIRQMREKVKYLPVEGEYKVYIIDEVHMLSGAAFNAFLKTLEEPPSRVVFVLATTDPQKVPATIISRCQCFDFHSVSRKVIVERLKEIVQKERREDPVNFPEVDLEALYAIAECAAGGFRDALSLLDQITASMFGGTVTLDKVLETTRRLGHAVLHNIAENIFKKNPSELLRQLDELFSRGHDTMTVGRDLLEYLRKCLVIKIDSKATSVLEIPPEQSKEIAEQVNEINMEKLMATAVGLERTVWNLRNSAHPRLLLEIELVRLALGEVSFGAEGLERRVAALENRMAGIGSLMPSQPCVGKPEYAGKSRVAPSLAADVPAEAEEPIEEIRGEYVDPNEEKYYKFQTRFSQLSKVDGAFLRQTNFEYFKDGAVVLSTKSQFHLERLRDPKIQSKMAPLLAEIFGPGATLVVKTPKELAERNPVQLRPTERIKTPSDNSPDTKDREPIRPPTAGHAKRIASIEKAAREKIVAKPPVRDALSVFGGEVIEIEPGNGEERNKI